MNAHRQGAPVDMIPGQCGRGETEEEKEEQGREEREERGKGKGEGLDGESLRWASRHHSCFRLMWCSASDRPHLLLARRHWHKAISHTTIK